MGPLGGGGGAGCSSADLKGLYSGPDGVTASQFAWTDPVVALNVPQPKKHLSPEQIRIDIHPKPNTNSTDIPESRGSRESRQVLHLCGWLMPLFYGFGEKEISRDNILVFLLSSAFSCSQLTTHKQPRFLMDRGSWQNITFQNISLRDHNTI